MTTTGRSASLYQDGRSSIRITAAASAWRRGRWPWSCRGRREPAAGEQPLHQCQQGVGTEPDDDEKGDHRRKLGDPAAAEELEDRTAEIVAVVRGPDGGDGDQAGGCLAHSGQD